MPRAGRSACRLAMVACLGSSGWLGSASGFGVGLRNALDGYNPTHTENEAMGKGTDWVVARRTALSRGVLAVCLLSMGHPSRAETNLRFYQSFDADLVATHACGPAEPVVSQNVTSAEGRVGKGVRIGTGSKLAYATERHVNPGSGTILLWIKPAAASLKSKRTLSIVDCGNADDKNNDVFLAYFPQLRAFGATFDAIGYRAFYDKRTTLVADRWIHLAMTWKCQRGICIYCDGVPVLDKRLTWAPTPVSSRFTVAVDRSLEHPVCGVFDELAIYDRALSKEEIEQHAGRTKGPLPTVPYAAPCAGPLVQPGTDVTAYMNREQVEPLAPRPEIYDLEHRVIHYDKKAYCGHPLQTVFRYYGKGELVVGHNHAPCNYAVKTDVQHGPGGYHGRAVQLLQRSTDYGKTWPKKYDVIIYRESAPPAVKRAFIFQPDAPRQQIDMFDPNSLFFFARTWLPERHGKVLCFGLRSPDRGRTWEKVPTILWNPFDKGWDLLKSCHPILRMPDGKTLLAAMAMNMPGAPKHSGPVLYRSIDNGLSWEDLGLTRAIPRGRTEGRFTYPGMLRMPNGDLHCYYLHIGRGYAVKNVQNAMCVSVSKDDGATWTDPLPIAGKGRGVWRNPARPNEKGVYARPCYRAPWPILLQDGRILVLFGRTRQPRGIGGVLSSDGGKTWSHEFAIRLDRESGELGYPVACQFEDGQIFVAYYYTIPDGNKFDGTRCMAASVFRVR